MDGESLWAIRKNGWLELGYNQTYFEKTMDRFGWNPTFHKGSDGPWSSAIIAQRTSKLGGEYSFKSGGLKTQVGKVDEKSGWVTTAGIAGYLVYGPYITLPKGFWRTEFICAETVKKSRKVFLDAFFLEA